MTDPDFLICDACDTPCYTFEWREGEILEANCLVCGNDESDQFSPPSDEDEAVEKR